LTTEHSSTILETVSALAEPRDVLRVLESATPLSVRSLRPERLELEVESAGPAAVIVTQLADPQWQARWSGSQGDRPARIVPVFAGRGEHGWQALTVPGPGRWTLHLEYVARDVQFGLIVSGLSFLVFTATWAFLRPGRPLEKAD
jgi:hypothetical protein